MSSGVEPEASTHPDEIKRTSGPQTKRQALGGPAQRDPIPRVAGGLFKTIGEFSRTVAPRRLEFDQACVVFESDEDHVKPWIESIDKWFASTNARTGSVSSARSASVRTASMPMRRNESGFNR